MQSEFGQREVFAGFLGLGGVQTMLHASLGELSWPSVRPSVAARPEQSDPLRDSRRTLSMSDKEFNASAVAVRSSNCRIRATVLLEGRKQVGFLCRGFNSQR